MKPTYPDGQEIRKGDTCRDGSNNIRRVTDVSDSWVWLDEVCSSHALLTLLRRANEFKGGDEVSSPDFGGNKCVVHGYADPFYCIECGNCEELYRVTPESLTLIKPVEDIEGEECMESRLDNLLLKPECFDESATIDEDAVDMVHAALHPCPRHDSTGCSGSIESGECSECGWPGLRVIGDRLTCDAGRATESDDRGSAVTGYNPICKVWRRLDYYGETIPQQNLRARWTADFARTTKHCRLCGRDGGCACGKEYC